MKNICKKHQESFTEIVECNDCNMLGGYMLVNRKTHSIFTMNEMPNIWIDEESCIKFAKKYGLYKTQKPIRVYIHFD